jgi:cation/acetate symporter
LVSLTYLIGARAGWDLPYTPFISYYLGAWYFAWIGAPLAILVHIVVSKLTEETPIEIRKFLIEKVHS